MDLGWYIKQYRKEHNMSIREFAKLCGLSHVQIIRMETGKNSDGKQFTPSIKSLKAVAKGTGIGFDDILQYHGENISAQALVVCFDLCAWAFPGSINPAKELGRKSSVGAFKVACRAKKEQVFRRIGTAESVRDDVGPLRSMQFFRSPHLRRVVYRTFRQFVNVEEAVTASEALGLAPVLNDGDVLEVIGFVAVHNLPVFCNPFRFPVFINSLVGCFDCPVCHRVSFLPAYCGPTGGPSICQ